MASKKIPVPNLILHLHSSFSDDPELVILFFLPVLLSKGCVSDSHLYNVAWTEDRDEGKLNRKPSTLAVLSPETKIVGTKNSIVMATSPRGLIQNIICQRCCVSQPCVTII